MANSGEVHICDLCKKPRVVRWSGKWTAVERLFLIALLAWLQRWERSQEKNRIDVTAGWEHATCDQAWMGAITSADASHIHIEFADLVVRTILTIDPDIKLDDWLTKIEGRFRA